MEEIQRIEEKRRTGECCLALIWIKDYNIWDRIKHKGLFAEKEAKNERRANEKRRYWSQKSENSKIKIWLQTKRKK